jgi:hypothetical protein
VARVREKANTYRVLMGKTEGKSLFGRSGRGKDDDIKMDLKKWDGGHRLN